MIKIDSLVKRYGNMVALDHFNLNVGKGEIYGLLGPNGSGKSTCIGCMLALLKYDKGDIFLFGEKVSPSNYDIKKRIGIVMQNVAVFDELNVRDNIDYFCGLYIDDKNIRKRYVNEAINFVGLEKFEKFVPQKLSGGLLRRLNIACGISHKPDLIIFDEPTVAVDPQSRENILSGIERLNTEGATVLYTTHYIDEVERICKKATIMDLGKNIISGSISDLKQTISYKEVIKIKAYSVEANILKDLHELNGVMSISYKDDLLTIKAKNNDLLIKVIDYIRAKGVHFSEINAVAPSLNDVFLEITGKDLRD